MNKKPQSRVITLRIVVSGGDNDQAIRQIETALNASGIKSAQVQYMAGVRGDESVTEALAAGDLAELGSALECSECAIPTGIDYVAVDRKVGGALAAEQSSDRLLHIVIPNTAKDENVDGGDITATLIHDDNGLSVDLLPTGAEDVPAATAHLSHEEANKMYNEIMHSGKTMFK